MMKDKILRAVVLAMALLSMGLGTPVYLSISHTKVESPDRTTICPPDDEWARHMVESFLTSENRQSLREQVGLDGATIDEIRLLSDADPADAAICSRLQPNITGPYSEPRWGQALYVVRNRIIYTVYPRGEHGSTGMLPFIVYDINLNRLLGL